MFRKAVAFLLALSLICATTCTAIANDKEEVNMMQYGYTIYDANGNEVLQPKAPLNTYVATIPAGGSLKLNVTINHITGHKYAYYVSDTGGYVNKLRLGTYYPSYQTIGYFVATIGDWYGTISKRILSHTGANKFILYNTSSVSLTIDSITYIRY